MTMNALKLPHLHPGRQRRKLKETEAGVQARIIEALEWRGYLVIDTTRKRKKQVCPKCSTAFWAQGGDGTSKGLPDLMVRREAWPRGVFAGLEIKTDTGRLSAEQQALAERGDIFVVRSHEEALAACELVNERVMRVAHPDPAPGDEKRRG